MNENEQVYQWQGLFDGTEVIGGLRYLYEEQTISLMKARRLVRASGFLYDLPTPKVLGRAHPTRPRAAQCFQGILWLPAFARSPEYVLHEFAHWVEMGYGGDGAVEHGPHFVTIFTDLLHGFGLHEKTYLRNLAKASGIEVASEHDVYSPVSREWEAGLKYLREG